jgi:hypothetical protein
MSKKDKIVFQNPSDLDDIDGELTAAMDCLDETNKRIEDLLQTFAPPEPQEGVAAEPTFTETVTGGEDASTSDESPEEPDAPPSASKS